MHTYLISYTRRNKKAVAKQWASSIVGAVNREAAITRLREALVAVEDDLDTLLTIACVDDEVIEILDY